MKPYYKIYCTFCVLFFLIVFGTNCFAQAPKAILDRNDILIGEKIKLDLFSQKQNEVIIPDTIPHFDIITKESRDTIVNGVSLLKTVLVFTSFDSGVFYFPELKNNTNAIASDSFVVNVGYMPIDKEAVPRDIKTIVETDYTDWSFLKWIAIALVVLLILFFIAKKIFTKKESNTVQPNKNAYKDAILALQNIRSQNESNNISIKDLHTALASILKTYYSAIDNTNVLSKTSDEVLQKLDAIKLKAEIALQTKAALQTGDATKFAMYKPLNEENNNAINFIKNTIDAIDNIHQKK